MSSLKDALVRVSRVVRHYEQIGQPRPSPVLLPTSPAAPKHTKRPVRARIPRSQLHMVRPQLSGFLKKRYQRFLAPLDMPQLKIYDNNLEEYDETRAELNLANKSSKDRLQAFTNFLGERQTFDKMMALLVELTPPDLMDKETVENSVQLRHVLQREEQKFRVTRNFTVPRFHFGEVPPFPHPLTKQSFYEYIYFLTHSRLLYRNSSSLMSGIVPEILLYTHNLENATFKPFRSTESYNCLIKYFGYDKFQNSFARELLLVMVKDGHRPNINTVNQLLKICRIHRNRRSLISTYKVVTNYLHLARQLELPLTLATWNRVYDCIDNIFLKEAFLNKMSAVSLPVSGNMCIRILEDFCETTTDPNDVVHFVEHDLCRPMWKQDPRMAEKVLYHKIKHMPNNESLGSVFKELWPQIASDSLTLKIVANAIEANPNFTHKAYLVFCMYTNLSPQIGLIPPEVYSRAVQLFSANAERYRIPKLNMFARGIIHHDARRTLDLPVETVEYEPSSGKSKRHPYKIPHAALSEHYRIFKRFSHDSLNVLEAKVLHYNKVSEGKERTITCPWVPLSATEEKEWETTIATIRTHHQDFWIDTKEKAASLGLARCKRSRVPPRALFAYNKFNSIRTRVSNEINTVKKLQQGLDAHLEREMRERNIYTPELSSKSA